MTTGGVRRDVIALAIVVSAALLPRLLLIAVVPERPLMADMVDYYARATHLYESGTLSRDAFRVPLFPMALAATFGAVGHGIHAVRVLQCVVFVGIALATYALARTWLSPERALAAAVLVALYPGFLLYTLYAMAEPLYTLLLLCALLIASLSVRAPAMFAAGLIAGVATLTRQAGVSLIAGLAAYAALTARAVTTRRWPQHAGAAAAVILGAAIAIAPWALRNWNVFGRWMPLESTSGVTYLIAQYEGATGRYYFADWDAVHEKYLKHSPEEFTRSADGYRLGWALIKAEPLRIIQLVPRRLGYLFDLEEREHAYLYSVGYLGQRAEWLVRAAGWLLLLSFPAVVLPAVLSVFCGPRPTHAAELAILTFLGVALLQHLNLFGDPRFHLPYVPLFSVLAMRPWRSLGRTSRGVSKVLGVVIVVALLAWWATRLPAHVDRLNTVAPAGGWSAAITY